MTNTLTFLLFAIILFAAIVLFFNWGIRIGKALQVQPPPPLPLEEPVKQAAGIVKKIGKRTVRLINTVQELKTVKRRQKEESEDNDLFN